MQRNGKDPNGMMVSGKLEDTNFPTNEYDYE